MIGKPVALLQVPSQRLFSAKAAARYLRVHVQTLRKLSALGRVRARRPGNRRAYTLEELDRFIEALPGWCDADGENPRIPGERRS